jgi:thiol:disulfide interchange protein
MRRALFSILCVIPGLLSGQDLFDDFGAKTKVKLLVEPATAKAGDTIDVALHLEMPDGWHTYWRNPGENGMPTSIKWTLPEGITAGAIRWPVPEKVEWLEMFTYAYHHEALLIIPLTLSTDLAPGEYTLAGKVEWLECEETCIPGEAEVSAKLVVGAETKPGEHAALFQKWRGQWPAKNEIPQLPAAWAGAANADGERTVRLTVPVSGKDVKVHFLPYSTKGKKWEIAHATKLTKGETEFTLSKTITSKDGKWPTELRGVVRFEVNGKVTGHETAFQIGEAEKEGDAIPGDPPKSLWYILSFAFIGGLILNIMPCVLPVISLKILGFVQQADEAPERVRKLGLTYALGVLFSFLVLAGMMIAVKKSTGMASWGMQMQNPYFNLALMLVVALVALNLFGLFEVALGGGAMTKANDLASREGYIGAFFNGILATALATPCTAPFLAGGMGAALTQSGGVIIAAMSAVAAGLAFPYVLLSFQPGWLKFLPKPGLWMVQFKQIMGFPMLAAAVWILSFTGPMFGKGGVMWLGVLLCVVALGAWMFGEFMQRNVAKSSVPLVAVGVVLAAGYFTTLEWGLDWRNKDEGVKWEVWSPEAVAKAREAGHPVLVDFTADWCLTCKWTKGRAIEVKPVIAKLAEIGGVAFIADWTDKNPVITKALHEYKRGAVPLVLVYPPEGEAIILPPVMSSPGKVLDALDKAASSAN